MKPIFFKVDQVTVNLAQIPRISRLLSHGSRPGVWWEIATSAKPSPHIVSDHLISQIMSRLLESGWIELNISGQEHLINSGLISEISTESAGPCRPGTNIYTFYVGHGKEKASVFQCASMIDPIANALEAQVSAPKTPLPQPNAPWTPPVRYTSPESA